MGPGSYAFIYDEALNERRYERMLAAIETRLTTLGLTGRTVRLAMFRSAKDAIDTMVKHGVSTIVIVGNDRTLDKVMWFLPDMNVTMGYLPVFGPSEIGGPLGIPEGIEACDVLAARIVETVDVGICEGRYFLTEVKVSNTVAAVDVEGKFRLSPLHGGTIIVRNLDVRASAGEIRSDAKDGLLEVIVKPKDSGSGSRWSRQKSEITKLTMQSGEIISPEPIDLHIDGHVTNGFRFRFGIVPRKLKLIAGRNRRLSPQDGVLPNHPESATLAAAR
jgi:diacylglycerol kinase family enzyme